MRRVMLKLSTNSNEHTQKKKDSDTAKKKATGKIRSVSEMNECKKRMVRKVWKEKKTKIENNRHVL